MNFVIDSNNRHRSPSGVSSRVIARSERASSSALADTICRIFFVSASKQMIRVYAWRIVATMASVMSRRERSECKLPRDSSGPRRSPLVAKAAVAIPVLASGPNPAIAPRAVARRLINLRPKPLLRMGLRVFALTIFRAVNPRISAAGRKWVVAEFANVNLFKFGHWLDACQ